QLDRRIVRTYHGEPAAAKAQEHFEARFSRREVPEDLPTWTRSGSDAMGIKDLLVASGLASSGSAGWRAVEQGAVSIDGVRISEKNHRQVLDGPLVLRLGRKMIRVEPS